MRARTSDEFLIRDVPGTSGRLDVVCRILVSAYRTVPQLAPSIRVNAVLGGQPNPPLCLEVGEVMPGEFPESELECALILKGLFARFQTDGEFIDPLWPQFRISTKGFQETLQTVVEQKKQILYLVETGQLIEEVKLNLDAPMVLILGDDQGLPAEHKKEVYTHSVQEVSIGTRSLLGSQVITLVLLELMRRQKMNEARSS